MSPTYHIGRLCKRLPLRVLARGDLSGFLNTKLSVGGVFRRVYSEERFLHFWRGKVPPRFRLLQTRARKFSEENCKMWNLTNIKVG